MSDKKKELGDYQTPLNFANEVVKYIKDNYDFMPDFIIEPNCGIGNFFKATEQYYKSKMIGIEINKNYSEIAKRNNPKAVICNQSIFEYEWEENIKKFDNVLILGNPPWVTNTELGKLNSENLPQKTNLKKYKGIEALSGLSNFDISESIILKLLNKFSQKKFILAMLCKKSVSINIFKELYRTGYKSGDIKIIDFDSRKIFNISVSACLLIIDCSRDVKVQKKANIYNFDNSYVDTIGYANNKFFLSTNYSSDLDGKCEFEWRQGIKHDCSKICELELSEKIYINGLKEKVEIEKALIYPLIKSSHIKNFKENVFKKYVLVTQKKMKEDTLWIKEKYPKTWDYLEKHKDNFIKRKSSIYKKMPQYSMFGIGDYSYVKYKVAISGFYKEPIFKVIFSEKPVMVDDTCYFLAFENKNDAEIVCDVLNSTETIRFLKSISDMTAKRPFTKKVLSRIEFKKFNYRTLKYTEKEILDFKIRNGLHINKLF